MNSWWPSVTGVPSPYAPLWMTVNAGMGCPDPASVTLIRTFTGKGLETVSVISASASDRGKGRLTM